MRIGIDVGGTFTDFVVYLPGRAPGERQRVFTHKELSTPRAPEEAVLAGLARILSRVEGARPTSLPGQTRLEIVHGSTVATNTLLERKGAKTALVTTRGFRDVLRIGRQNRPSLYDLLADPPEPLVPDHWVREVDERIDDHGQVLTPLDLAEVSHLIPFFKEEAVEAIAICTLFSFLEPAHERAIGERLRAAGFFVSLSTEILPEFREFERTSTTVINAYVAPVMDRYLARLEQGLNGNELRIMQSNGGSINPVQARREAVRGILSGPAGGVVASLEVGRLAGYDRVIGFDMGGTSTDVSLCPGEVQITTEASISGYPLRIPVLDIHTVGSGGGSIAWVDTGGALRVGPESAGADPGPACYGRGDRPTVTDAHLVLGRLVPEFFLGGVLPLHPDRARASISDLGRELGLDPLQTALGVIEIANVRMERALRVISVDRGYDPKDFTLVSFGGAGGLHAVDLARRLGIRRVLIPPQAATLSALGMLLAEVVKDYSRTVMLPGTTQTEALTALFQPLLQQAAEDLAREGLSLEAMDLQPYVDCRYHGQSFELTVPFCPTLLEDFHRIHAKQYDFADPVAEVEFVNLRVRAVGKVDKPVLPYQEEEADTAPERFDERQVVFPEQVRLIPFYRGETLAPGHCIRGPVVIVRPDTTILIAREDLVKVDGFGNLIIEVGQERYEGRNF